MLSQLLIKNIALMDSLQVDFGPGLNCLTGETGAGKSIILDSILFLLGARSSKEAIRHGQDSASVQGVFITEGSLVSPILEEMGVPEEEDHTLVLYREFSLSGRNVCRINGMAATVSMLKRLGEVLLDLHGQQDNQSLLRAEAQRKLLDSYAGESMRELRQPYSDFLTEFRKLREDLEGLSGDPMVRERTRELLSYQIEEINQAKLASGEEEFLLPRRMVLANAEKISFGLEKVYDILQGGYEATSVNQLFDKVERELSGLQRYGSRYEALQQKWQEISYLLEDWTALLREEKEEAVTQPEELAEIEERLDLLARLKRKYGHTVDDILAFGEAASAQLEELNQSEGRYEFLQREQARLRRELLDLCERMHGVRQAVSGTLAARVCEQLEDLEMPGCRFSVDLHYEGASEAEVSFGPAGLDQVEFQISANRGEPLKSLAKVASGGELSRIMLAIKTVLAEVDRISTLIFDEIDMGISGQAARKVGERMKWISRNHQVICVTHLAQIAAIADTNILISKNSQGDHTVTSAVCLDEQAKVLEIARLLDGDATSELTRRHAQEMIEKAGQIPSLPTV